MSLPKRFPDRDEIASVRAEAELLEPGAEVDDKRRVSGRVVGRREMGKLAFLDLVDRSGRIQLLCDTSRTGPIDVDLGDIVGVTGSPARAKRGEPSIAVDELEADYYLRIATELYLKRLIVGGLEKVYELGKDFRNEGLSYKHVPEFTMLEWYEAYTDYRDQMERVEQLIESVARETTGDTKVTYRSHEVDLKAPWRRVRLVDALDDQGLWTRDPDELRSRLDERGVDTSHDRSWAQLVDHALSHFVEPALIEPTFLHDYPVELSPFARTTDEDPAIVERFEYFVGGTELGNAFSELNDPAEQAARFEQQAAEVGGEPGDPDYVEALAYGMPPTGGVGLGIDRLTMVLAGRDNIRDVVLFPALRER